LSFGIVSVLKPECEIDRVTSPVWSELQLLSKSQKKRSGIWSSYEVDELGLQIDGTWRADWTEDGESKASQDEIYKILGNSNSNKLKYTIFGKARMVYFRYDLDGGHTLRNGSTNKYCTTSASKSS